jgi:Rps23 Pro-64 3,4-dihydroxylase Tpa1-like proline 4-hydroxylase
MSDVAVPEALLALDTYLNAPVRTEDAMDRIGVELSAGRLVVIRDAFHQAFAEQMYRALDTCTSWRVHEKFEDDFHYHHHNLYDEREYPSDLRWCRQIFSSPGTKSLASRLSGRSCDGPALFSASWYLPGDHSLPHTDAIARGGADTNRQIAFVWHLAKHWRPEWGGSLFWCPRSLYLPPVFNTLVLFNVGPDTSHFVTTVSPYAQGKRLAINGWWTGLGSTGDPRSSDPTKTFGGIEVY